MERPGETPGDTEGAWGALCPQSPCSLSDAAWGGAWPPCCVYTPVLLHQPHTSKQRDGWDQSYAFLWWAGNCCHRHARASLGRRWVPPLRPKFSLLLRVLSIWGITLLSSQLANVLKQKSQLLRRQLKAPSFNGSLGSCPTCIFPLWC